MAEDVHSAKIRDLQQYIPFIESMIVSLKDPRKKNRDAQLSKMEALYGMITDTKKRYKLETLIKCEEVILKLQSKVNPRNAFVPKSKPINPNPPLNCLGGRMTDVKQIMNVFKYSSTKANMEWNTPKSPSPVRDIPQHEPVVIPTEKIELDEPLSPDSDVDIYLNSPPRYAETKPNIYSSVAQTFAKTPIRIELPPPISTKVPELFTPPLSMADLELLENDDSSLKFENLKEDKKPFKEVECKLHYSKPTRLPSSKPKSSYSDKCVKENITKTHESGNFDENKSKFGVGEKRRNSFSGKEKHEDKYSDINKNSKDKSFEKSKDKSLEKNKDKSSENNKNRNFEKNNDKSLDHKKDKRIENNSGKILLDNIKELEFPDKNKDGSIKKNKGMSSESNKDNSLQNNDKNLDSNKNKTLQINRDKKSESNKDKIFESNKDKSLEKGKDKRLDKSLEKIKNKIITENSCNKELLTEKDKNYLKTDDEKRNEIKELEKNNLKMEISLDKKCNSLDRQKDRDLKTDKSKEKIKNLTPTDQSKTRANKNSVIEKWKDKFPSMDNFLEDKDLDSSNIERIKLDKEQQRNNEEKIKSASIKENKQKNSDICKKLDCENKIHIELKSKKESIEMQTSTFLKESVTKLHENQSLDKLEVNKNHVEINMFDNLGCLKKTDLKQSDCKVYERIADKYIKKPKKTKDCDYETKTPICENPPPLKSSPVFSKTLLKNPSPPMSQIKNSQNKPLFKNLPLSEERSQSFNRLDGGNPKRFDVGYSPIQHNNSLTIRQGFQNPTIINTTNFVSKDIGMMDRSNFLPHNTQHLSERVSLTSPPLSQGINPINPLFQNNQTRILPSVATQIQGSDFRQQHVMMNTMSGFNNDPNLPKNVYSQQNMMCKIFSNTTNVNQNIYLQPDISKRHFNPFEPLDSVQNNEYDLSKINPINFNPTVQNFDYDQCPQTPNEFDQRCKNQQSLGNREFFDRNDRFQQNRYHNDFDRPRDHFNRFQRSYSERDTLKRDFAKDEEYPTFRDFKERYKNFRSEASTSKPIQKEELKKSRDPRLNRENRDFQKQSISIDKAVKEITEFKDERKTKYDEMYAKLEKNSEQEEKFSSPLDSLYTVKRDVTGKGYGVQKFKIPKKMPKTVEVPKQDQNIKIESSLDVGSDDDDLPLAKKFNVKAKRITKIRDSIDKEDVNTNEVEDSEDEIKEDEKTDNKTFEEDKVKEVAVKVQGEELKVDLQNEEKTEMKSIKDREKYKKIEEKNSKEDDESGTEDLDKLELVAKSLKSFEILESILRKKSKKEEGESIVDLLRSYLVEHKSKKKTKRVLYSSDSSDEGEAENMKNEEVDEEKESNKQVDIKACEERKAAKNRIKRKRKNEIEQKETQQEDVNEEGVAIEQQNINATLIENVGKRMKNRRKNSSQEPATKKNRKSELDKLHEDIKEMLMGNDIFATNVKRNCTQSKEDTNNELSNKIKEKTAQKQEIKQIIESPRSKATNLRVVIEKLDLQDSLPEFNKTETKILPKNKKVDIKSKSKGEIGNENFEVKSKESNRKSFLRSAKIKVNYSEKGENEASNVPVEKDIENEEPLVEEEQNQVKTKLRKKKTNTWAQGVIKKKKKPKAKEVSATGEESKSNVSEDLEEEFDEEEEEETVTFIEPEFVKPDKNYYYIPNKKIQCKLCSLSSMNLSNHYRISHPNHENFISRISPEDTDAAVKESLELNYSSITEVEMVDKMNRKIKFDYKCRFCEKMFNNVNTEHFYEHLTVHTGEYRYHCPNCTFKTPAKKTLRQHLMQTHGLSLLVAQASSKPMRPLPPNFPMVFGYTCLECNFIQIQNHLVVEHFRIYHGGKSLKISKINMSSICSKDNNEMEGEMEADSTVPDVVSEVQEKSVQQALFVEENQNNEAKSNVVKKRTGWPKGKPRGKKKFKSFGGKRIRGKAKRGGKRFKGTANRNVNYLVESVVRKPSVEEKTDEKKDVLVRKKNLERKVVSVENDGLVKDDVLVDEAAPKRALTKKALMQTLMQNKNLVLNEGLMQKKVLLKNETLVNEKALMNNEMLLQNKVEIETFEESVPLNEPIPETIVDKTKEVLMPKEPDMNVFMCDADILQENENIEEERLKTMENINKQVRTSRTSIASKLKDRFEIISEPQSKEENDFKNIHVKEEVLMNEESIDVKELPLLRTEVTTEPSIVETIESKLPLAGYPKILVKSVKKLNESISKLSLFNPSLDDTKKSSDISNIINRLQDKLSIADANLMITKSEPPPLTPLSSLKLPVVDDNPVTRIGPIEARCLKTGTLFSCYIPGCSFRSKNVAEFGKHCSVIHKDIKTSFYCGLCTGRMKSVGSNCFMIDVFNHMLNKHLLQVDVNVIPREEDSPVIRMAEDSPFPFKITSVVSQGEEIQSGPKFGFVISNVVSLANEKENEDQNGDLNKNHNLNQNENLNVNQNENHNVYKSDNRNENQYDNQKILSSQPQSMQCQSILSQSIPPEMIPLHTIHFQNLSSQIPPTIHNLPQDEINRSLLSTSQLSSTSVDFPKLDKQSETSKRVLLKDIPMKSYEINIPRKSSAAMQNILMTCASLLYKCPEYNCCFASNNRVLFETHLDGHPDLVSTEVPCLYCNFKTSFQHVAQHITIRHGSSKFTCGYCFYRAVCSDYVKIHQRYEHPNKQTKVVVLKTSVVPIDNLQPQPMPLKAIIKPFVCGVAGCGKKVLCSDDFFNHLVQDHQNVDTYTCYFCKFVTRRIVNMLYHMQDHGISMYHCRYCHVGNCAVTKVCKHLAFEHSVLPPQIVIRKFKPSGATNDWKHLDLEDDKVYEQLSKYPDDFELGGNINLLSLDINDFTFQTVPKKDLSRNLNDSFDSESLDEHVRLDIATLSDDLEVAGNSEVSSSDDLRSNENKISSIQNNNILKEDKEENEQKHRNKNETVFKNILSLDSNTADEMTFENEDSNDVEEVEDEEKKKNLSGVELFKCAYCDVRFKNSVTFKKHWHRCPSLANNTDGKPYKCPHCSKSLKHINTLVDHIRIHGTPRFCCSLCDYKHAHPIQLKHHMRSKHKVLTQKLVPVNPSKNDVDSDIFVMRPLQKRKSTDSSTTGVKENLFSEETKINNSNKLYLNPSEQDKLPLQSIYSTDVHCALCEYKSKVRLNMVKHFQQHLSNKIVSVSAPVNPVPCLEKNEKMFDKMTNLAISSHSITGRMSGNKHEKIVPREEQNQFPAFVPSTKRFVCGMGDCTYLSLDESMLRRHITALHADEQIYKCKHCPEVITIEKSVNIDDVLKHLRLHDLTLYKCAHCNFLHQTKGKIEKHLSEKHTEIPLIKVIREMTVEIDSHESFSKEQKLWRCGICKYRCSEHKDIVIHVSNKHFVNVQFKCALCSYNNNVKDTFSGHFESNHPGHEVDIIDVYYKDETVKSAFESNAEQFDTTPLWKRDNNKVKHIRGILLEENVKFSKKSPLKILKEDEKKSEGSSSKKSVSKINENMWKSIEAVVSGVDSVTNFDYEFEDEVVNMDEFQNNSEKVLGGYKKRKLQGDKNMSIKREGRIQGENLQREDIQNKSIIKSSFQNQNPLKENTSNNNLLDKSLMSESSQSINLQNVNVSDTSFLDNFQNTNILGDACQNINLIDDSFQNKNMQDNSQSIVIDNETLLRQNYHKHTEEGVSKDFVEKKVQEKYLEDELACNLEGDNYPEENVKKKNLGTGKIDHLEKNDQTALLMKLNLQGLDVEVNLIEKSLKENKDVSLQVVKDGNFQGNADEDFQVNQQGKNKEITQGKKEVKIQRKRMKNVGNSPQEKKKGSPQKKKAGISRVRKVGNLKKTNAGNLKEIKTANFEEIEAENFDGTEAGNFVGYKIGNIEIIKAGKIEKTKAENFEKIKKLKIQGIKQTEDQIIEKKETEEGTKDPSLIFHCEGDKSLVVEKEMKNTTTLKSVDSSAKVHNEMNLIKSDDNMKRLISLYGDFGQPQGKNFCCPICLIYFTDNTSDFTIHLFTELKYFKYSCTTCDFVDSSVSVVQRHSLLEHQNDSVTVKNTVLSPDIEMWVKAVIDNQQSDIDALVALQSKTKMQQCKYCPYSCRYSSDLRKHVKRHWAVKPFKCFYCSFEGVTRYEVGQHIRRSHQGMEIVIETKEIPENPPIIALGRKRKIQPECTPVKKVQGVEPKNQTVVSCSYCNFVGKDIKEIIEHCKTNHDVKLIGYRIGPNENPKRRKKNELKCFYCPLIATPDILTNHHQEAHSGMPFKVFRYTCRKCNEIFEKLEQVKDHFSLYHVDSNLTYIDIFREVNRSIRKEKNAGSKTDTFKCPKCKYTSNNVSYIKEHIRYHAKPYRCSDCQHSFVYSSLVLNHIAKEHPEKKVEVIKVQENIESISEMCSNILISTEEGEFVPYKNKKGTKRESEIDEGDASKIVVLDENMESEDELLAIQKSVKNRKPRVVSSQTSQSPVEIDVQNVKQTARKSTGYHESKEFSFYGLKPNNNDLKTITTNVEIAGTSVNMPVEQFANIFNLYPELKIERCNEKT